MDKKTAMREEAIDRLSAHILRTGLSQVSLRQLADAAGVSDRMLLYYFTDKADVITAALANISEDLAQSLEALIPAGETLPPADLIRLTTGLVHHPETKPYFRLWTEIIAAVVRDPAQFQPVASGVAERFLDWIESRLAGGDKKTRKATAAMIVAMVDGLALLEICTDEKRSKAAAKQMSALAHPDFD